MTASSAPAPQAGGDDVLELRHYLAVLRRRRTTVAVVTVAAVVLALAVSLAQTPIYRASTEVLLQTRASEALFSPDAQSASRPDPSQVATEIRVMRSRSVRDAVAEALGRPVTVDIRPDGETDVVIVTAESTDAAEAARSADTYAEVSIETRRRQQIDDLEVAIAQVQAKIGEFDQEIDALDPRLADVDARIAAATTPADVAELRAQRADVEAEVEDLESQQSPYVAQLDRLQLAINLTQTGGAEIVGQAQVPTSPARPDPLRNALLALVGGGVLGVGLAFGRDHLDDTIKTKEDLQAATGGAVVLGLIPAMATWRDRDATPLVSLSDPRSMAAEAYRSLRTSVQFIALDTPVKAIQLTSPNASEGKTVTLANLAVAMASAGQRVVVVCCDLRRPRIHEFLGLDNEVGFTSVLLGDVPLSKAIQAVPGQENLALLASGPIPPNPSELLASLRVQELFALLRAESDVLLLDTPPVLPVSDALAVSRVADATIVVNIAKTTTRHAAQRALELLHQVRAPVAGTVLNGVAPDAGYGYTSSYRETGGGAGSGRASLAPRHRRQRGADPTSTGTGNSTRNGTGNGTAAAGRRPPSSAGEDDQPRWSALRRTKK